MEIKYLQSIIYFSNTIITIIFLHKKSINVHKHPKYSCIVNACRTVTYYITENKIPFVEGFVKKFFEA